MPGLQLTVTVRNSGFAPVSNFTLEGWPQLAVVLSCSSYMSTSVTWQSASINPGENLYCHGTYLYSEDELYGGPQDWNLTVAGVSSRGTRVSSTRHVLSNPHPPMPNLVIQTRHMSFDNQVDMQGNALNGYWPHKYNLWHLSRMLLSAVHLINLCLALLF